MCLHRLPEVVLHWAAGLLADCGKERHGVDLFGRDAWLLGRLLLTLVSSPQSISNE